MKAPPRTPRDGLGPLIKCACGCGGELRQFDGNGRERTYLHGHVLKHLTKITQGVFKKAGRL